MATDASKTAQQELRPPTADQALATARKFSGNSLRVKRTHYLYHGTLLYNFDLALVPALLRTPPRQPDYRQARNHADFIANVPLTRALLETALITAWPTTGELTDWPPEKTNSLVRDRYTSDEWNFTYGSK